MEYHTGGVHADRMTDTYSQTKIKTLTDSMHKHTEGQDADQMYSTLAHCPLSAVFPYRRSKDPQLGTWGCNFCNNSKGV